MATEQVNRHGIRRAVLNFSGMPDAKKGEMFTFSPVDESTMVVDFRPDDPKWISDPGDQVIHPAGSLRQRTARAVAFVKEIIGREATVFVLLPEDCLTAAEIRNGLDDAGQGSDVPYDVRCGLERDADGRPSWRMEFPRLGFNR